MKCAACGHLNPEESRWCEKCHQPLDDEASRTKIKSPKAEDMARGPARKIPDEAPDDAPPSSDESPTQWRAEATPGAGPSSPATPRPDSGVDFPGAPESAGATGELPAHHCFGDRFEILALLGVGGMGRVYKAWDRELEKLVALKTIRSERADKPDALKRFKQELLLARQITHKNVIRIHDMGEAEGIKFFTMEFIDGESLKEHVQRKGRLSPDEAVDIAKQILSALEEAHRQGVIHRDLKPQNIMIDPEGMAHVMDFGIARSVQDTGITGTHVVMGTPDYMSPEQARGEKAGAQADLFSFGVILYEVLTGVLPYGGDTMVSRVMARLSQTPEPLRGQIPEVPKYLENIVSKCLEVDPALRYESASAILDDIEREHVDRALTLRARKAAARRKAGLAATVITVAALATAAYFALTGKGPPAEIGSTPSRTTLAILPFTNATTDPDFDWLGATLAEILTTEVGQSERLRIVTSERVNQILSDLRIKPGSRIDPTVLARVAEFSSADTVVSGQYLKLGDRIRIDATLRKPNEEQVIPLKAEAPDEEALLETIRGLAQEVQSHLGLSRDTLETLQPAAFRPSCNSIQALRFYNEGMQLARHGTDLEALKRFQAATEEDSSFALAYAALGQTYANLGYDYEAEESLRTAVDLGAMLPQEERFLILATHARIQKDYDKAIDSYEKLAAALPANSEIHFRLGELYEDKNEYERARELYAQVLERDPNDLAALVAMGRVQMRSQNPQSSFEPLNKALSLAIRLGKDETRGNILYHLGVAYRLLGNTGEALHHSRDSLAVRTELGDKRGMAASLKEIARVQWALGEPDETLAGLEESFKLESEIGDRSGAGNTLLTLGDLYYRRGDYRKALELLKDSLQIQRELQDTRYEAVCLNSMGNVYMDQREFADAQTHFELALRIREDLKLESEISETIHNLGEIASQTGRYNEAVDRYLRALELARKVDDKLGVAIEGYSLGKVFGYQGRLAAALDSMEQAIQSLDEIKEGGYWRAEVLTGYGGTLNLLGRFDEAQSLLEEAFGLARELGNQSLIARVLHAQGESLFYRNASELARQRFEEALASTSLEEDPGLRFPSRLYLAKLALREGQSPSSSLVETLRELAAEADALKLEYHSSECSLALAEALLRRRQLLEAQQTLEAALRETDRLGLRIQAAKSHHLLGEVLRAGGNEGQARRHYREAASILEELREQAATGEALPADLERLYRESLNWSSEKSVSQ